MGRRLTSWERREREQTSKHLQVAKELHSEEQKNEQ